MPTSYGAGILDDAGVIFTDRRDFYINPNTYKQLYAPATAFVSNITPSREEMVPDPDYKMFEHRQPWMKQYFSLGSVTSWSGSGTVNDTCTCTPTNIVGMNSNSGSFISGDESYIRYEGEIYDSTFATYKGYVRIKSVSGSSVTLTSLGKTDASPEAIPTLSSTDVFVLRSTSRGEGQYAGTAWHTDLTTVWNSAKIMDLPVEITGTLYQAALRGAKNELARYRAEKLEEWKVIQERTMLFGHRPGGIGSAFNPTSTDYFVDSSKHVVDKDGKVVRETMGFITAMRRYGDSDDSSDSQNWFNRTFATYSYNMFLDDIQKVSQYEPTKGYYDAYVAGDVLAFFNKRSAGGGGFVSNSGWNELIMSDMKRDRLGFNYRWLETPFAILRLIRVPLFTNQDKGYLLIIDSDNISVVTYRKDEFRMNVMKDNDYDGEKDVLFADKGLKINMIEKHAVIKFK